MYNTNRKAGTTIKQFYLTTVCYHDTTAYSLASYSYKLKRVELTETKVEELLSGQLLLETKQLNY